MQKISEENRKVILDILKTISMLFMIAVIIFCLVLSAVFIGVVFEVRPEYKKIFDDKIFESFNSVTASAAEENVVAGTEYSVPIAPGAVLIYEDFDHELVPLWSYNDGSDFIDLSSLNLTGGIYQVVCMAFYTLGSDDWYSAPLTNLLYVDSEYSHQTMCVGDYGAADALFDITLNLSDSILFHDNFINSFGSSDNAYVVFHALYKIEDNSSDETISDSFFGAISDGVTFGFDAIPSGITYIFDELFIHEGKLTIYSYAVFSLCGVAIVLGLIKFLLSYLFSLGGK